MAKILEHAISTDDQRFQNIFVKGDRIINPVEGIRTRSKVKNGKILKKLILNLKNLKLKFYRTRTLYASAFASENL